VIYNQPISIPEKINKNRVCRYCHKTITDEPGVAFAGNMGGKYGAFYYHKECLLGALYDIEVLPDCPIPLN
jgi:hypothetical protein